jgi:hypothetical protein
MIIIHINIGKKDRKKKKDSKKKETSPDKAVEEGKIDFKPTMEECCDFFRGAFNEMIESTN